MFRILIAEDDDDIARLYGQLLCADAQERECEIVGDGRAAIRAYERASADGCPFDLLLLDVMMPKLNGFQVAQHVRFECCDQDTDIVIVTGSPDAITPMRAEYVHALEVWTKPIDPKEFERRIGWLLSRRAALPAGGCAGEAAVGAGV